MLFHRKGTSHSRAGAPREVDAQLAAVDDADAAVKTLAGGGGASGSRDVTPPPPPMIWLAVANHDAPPA